MSVVRFVAMCALMGLVACSSSSTAIVVQVDTDFPTGAIATISISILGTAAPVMVPVAGDGGVSFPLTLTIVPGTSPTEALDVTVVALDASGAALVSREVRTNFVASQTVTVQVMLLARCAGIDCGGTGTCTWSGCAAPDVPAGALAPWPHCSPAFADCNGSASDGCEVDLRTSAAHCGTCAHACPAADTCRQGVCESERVASVVAGDAFTCALLQNGLLMCWGQNTDGQLGDGTMNSRAQPMPVDGITAPLAVAAGSAHACAVIGDGGVECWGRGDAGQLGSGGTTDQSTPTPVAGLSVRARGVALGDAHTCARLNSGAVYCWGDNGFLQLSNATAGRNSATPLLANLGSGVGMTQSIAAGESFTCVAHTLGVTCWGNNASHQVTPGMGNTSGPLPIQLVPSGRTDVAAISNGAFQACALFTDHTAECWGGNQAGEIGTGTPGGDLQPTPLPLTGNIAVLEAGGYHICAATDAPAVYCWGQNSSGEAGVNALSPVSAPTLVLTGVATSIAAGALHTCVVRDGIVACWGSNSDGQLGDDTPTGRWYASPVQFFP